MSSKFRTGTEASADSSGSKVPFDRTGWLSLKDKDVQVVRFVMDGDEWATVEYHSFIPVTKEAPEGRKNWPKEGNGVSAVCRKTKDQNGVPFYSDCWVCENKPENSYGPVARATRTFSLCILRELIDPKNPRGGYRDTTKEVVVVGTDGKPTGETQFVPDFRWVMFGYKNFFGSLEGFYENYGTLLDRDYKIKRNGAKTDTVYQITPMDPTPDFDLSDPFIAARYGIKVVDGERIYPAKLDLESLIDNQMSDEHYGLYFDTTKPQVVNEADIEVEKPDNDSSGPKDLKDKLKAYREESKV